MILEQNRLDLLQSSLKLKRPVQSLRFKGPKGLPESQTRPLIQEMECKATLMAIESKKRDIRILESQIKRLKLKDNSVISEPNLRLLHIQQKKLCKKLDFLKKCDDTKFSELKSRKFIPRTSTEYQQTLSSYKSKKKAKAKARKLRKKESSINLRAQHALDNFLVINLTDLDIPKFSIAILSYGSGWIPTPKFNKLQYKIDCNNIANKQGWKSLFHGSDKVNDLPPDLLKKPVTATCTDFKDPVVKLVHGDITNFADNVTVKKMSSNMNKFEREGLDWLVKAVKDGKLAITEADKGGAIIIVTPDVIKRSLRIN